MPPHIQQPHSTMGIIDYKKIVPVLILVLTIAYRNTSQKILQEF